MRASSVSVEIARAIHRTRYGDLPAEAVRAAKTLMLDTLVVASAGTGATGVGPVRDLLIQQGGTPESRLWRCEQALPAPAAAFANALAASALDYDSLHQSVHPDAVALAAAWATAQRQRASGGELLTAFVLGSELTCRLARSATGPQKGWTLGAVFGCFGAAAASARLLALDAQGIANALGIALSMAAGSQQSNIEQVLTKRLQPAIAARSGVFAALLASAGISGPSEAFEGRFGLWNLYNAGSADVLMQDWGERFLLLETGLKKYPVCACSHAAVDIALRLSRHENLDPRSIERIEVTISPFMDRLVGGAFEPRADPQVTAQFSLRYALACALLRGHVQLSDLVDEAVLDPVIAEFQQRIWLNVDPGQAGELAPVFMRIRLDSGACLERECTVMPGSPASPLTGGETRSKHEDCSRHGVAPLGAAGLHALSSTIASIDEVGDMMSLAF